MKFLRSSLKTNIFFILLILGTVFYITSIYSPCPTGRFIYSSNKLEKWCESPDSNSVIQKHGPWVALYEDQLIKERGEFTFGKKDGHWVKWYPNSRKKEEGDYKDGQKVGKWSLWDINGNKQEKVYSKREK